MNLYRWLRYRRLRLGRWYNRHFGFTQWIEDHMPHEDGTHESVVFTRKGSTVYVEARFKRGSQEWKSNVLKYLENNGYQAAVTEL